MDMMCLPKRIFFMFVVEEVELPYNEIASKWEFIFSTVHD